jgi:hypothetical protein
MNPSVIIEDIRKRSHRVQREELIRRQREDEYEDDERIALSRRLIIGAEENVARKHAAHSWKRTTVIGILSIGVAYIIYRTMTMLSPKTQLKGFSLKNAHPGKTDTDKDDVTPGEGDDIPQAPEQRQLKTDSRVGNSRRVVMFSVDQKLDILQELYPRRWSKFERNFQTEWLVTSLRRAEKSLSIDFFLEAVSDTEDSVAIDMITSDMLQYPCVTKEYFTSQEEFENFIFTIKEKKDLCSARGIVYKVLQTDKM